jgi:phenylpropionate dioxygenase-like ring-hydroxylating dioxygenase large terminal subunit
MERIFKREWTCPGLAAEIPNAGDYITFSIGDQALYVIRGVDNQIRTFSNVCRHRLMTLVEGRGNKRKVVCPYHAWTYDSTGRLIGAGHMQKTEGFKKEDICLPQIRTEIWEGWIYVTLDSHAESVAKRLAELAPLVERFDMIGYVPVIQQDHVWDTNWKLLCENFLEGYHASFVHQQTVGAGFSVEKTEFPDTVHDAFTYQLFSKDEKAKFGRAHPDNKRLEGKWRHTSVLAFAYPTHLYSLAPDYLWYLSLRPHGTGQVHVRIGVAIAPEVLAASEDRDELVGTLTTFFDQANEEDRIVVEGIYRGSQSPLAESGPLSWLERSIYDFMGYLARKLAPPSQAGGAPY